MARLRELLDKVGATRAGSGLAEPGARLCQGAVYVIPKDVAEMVISYPNLRLPGAGERAEHDCRVVVLSPSALCDDDSLITVHVVPCSASARGPCFALDLDVSASEPGFTKPARAYVTIVQPVLKSDLKALARTGDVSPATLTALLARWQRLRTG